MEFNLIGAGTYLITFFTALFALWKGYKEFLKYLREIRSEEFAAKANEKVLIQLSDLEKRFLKSEENNRRTEDRLNEIIGSVKVLIGLE